MRRFRGSPGLPLATVSLLALLLVTVGAGSARGTTNHGVISGGVFADLNRDGTYQPDEPPLPDRQLYLFKGDAYVGTTLSDAAGRYSFGDLDDGEYSIECDASGLRADWVPSTTPSLDPKVAVSVNGAGDEYIDFGWRRLVHSTDPNLPLTTFVASTGLRIEMFNDALPAQALYERLMTGTLVGPEAASVTLRFGYGDASTTTTGVQESNGLYTNFLAVMQIGWGSWLNTGENALFHEYGHAWSLYHAYIVQQDPMFAGYLAVRGLTNDPQVDTSYSWSARELIAEDYRQLFGSPSVRDGTQMNTEVPVATQVPGLVEFLSQTFREPPSAARPDPESIPVDVSGLAMSPTLVDKSGTASFNLNTAAWATVDIRTSKGALVRTLAANATEDAGSVNLVWNRRSSTGQRVKPGIYVLSVRALDSSGHSDSETASFSVA